MDDLGNLTATDPVLPPILDSDAGTANLPRALEPWADATARPVAECLTRARSHGGWHWPERPVVFVSDPHADAEGFLRSLIAAGAIHRNHGRIALTPFGRKARIVLGGDTLDKGPSNLALLDAIAEVLNTGAEVTILAGNHDLRMRLAIGSVRGSRTALTEHLFVRMGRKILPALREVLHRFVTPDHMAALPSEAACKARLMPGPDWSDRFARAARKELRPEVIAREIRKLEQKHAKFERDRARIGLSHRELLAALLKCHDIFLEAGGHYAWFFDRMQVVARSGSLLFVHAGLCDEMAVALVRDGVDAVNAAYARAAESAAPGFYFGPLANLVRTKYRASDCALTAAGVETLNRAGLHMVVQGHVNNHAGQRLLAKQGLLHLEADITLDRASRALEGLDGIGAGATLIFPSGDVIGLSCDHPRAKHFAPERLAAH
ncbi:metallophosphoesterase [Pseudoponticoccus marisrubri]|uniref:Metallophosphoesterase n=1 Tax=Pseudoponticoccus marisrubri TaxID=1685382 RepID=A0A0W7WHP1_9RHOB|nr:metallophosphoesterase [Pseudoponticoccus marisrubri]KUF09992.1 metallophosphoesterase [Pseudoponticoccus marisrubri]